MIVKSIIWCAFLVLIQIHNSEGIGKPVLSEAGVSFALYSPNSDEFYYISLGMRDILTTRKFNPYRPTRFIIADFNQTEFAEVNKLLRHYYDASGEYNKIVVGYSNTLDKSDPLFESKFQNVGDDVGGLIMYMNRTCQMNLDEVIVVGFGFGAHVAGCAGKYVNRYNEDHKKFSTIVALDPTREFEKTMIEHSLSKYDAQGVVVFHTNVNQTGTFKRIGTADIYARNQVMQPGCYNHLCSHKKSIPYFINIRRFRIKRCRGIPEVEDKRCRKESSIYGIVYSDKTYRCGFRGVYLLDGLWKG